VSFLPLINRAHMDCII